jgi:hypothetical protein
MRLTVVIEVEASDPSVPLLASKVLEDVERQLTWNYTGDGYEIKSVRAT